MKKRRITPRPLIRSALLGCQKVHGPARMQEDDKSEEQAQVTKINVIQYCQALTLNSNQYHP